MLTKKITRKKMLAILGLSSLAIIGQRMSIFEKMAERFAPTPKMPVVFFGHGDPMNAILENEYTKGFKTIGEGISKPNAIICISAHWFTRGTKITAMERPKTIHDFGGFPEELFQVQYPAPGDPVLAGDIQKELQKRIDVSLDHDWGLDHGTWSVLKHLYPNADIPIIQISIDRTKPAQHHFEIAKQLDILRDRGVLIVGSGNIVHNLRLLDRSVGKNVGHDWAHEAQDKINKIITTNNFQELFAYEKLGQAVKLAIPTPEHFLPLLYILGLKRKNEKIEFYNDSLSAGSISMTSIKIS